MLKRRNKLENNTRINCDVVVHKQLQQYFAMQAVLGPLKQAMPWSKYSLTQWSVTVPSMYVLPGMSSAGSDETSQDTCAHRSYLYQRYSEHDWLCKGSKFPYVPLWTFSFVPSPHSAGDIQYDSDVQTRKKIFSPEKKWKGWTRFMPRQT